MTGLRIALVSCAAQKREQAAPAAQLYTSPLFVKAAAYAASTADCWYILSALYGLVTPETVIAPYNTTLNTMSRAECRAWAERVFHQMRECALISRANAICFLAGDRYRQDLLPKVQPFVASVEMPLQGLGIGQQLAWYKARGY